MRTESRSLLIHAYNVLGLIEEECGDTEAAWLAYSAARSESENLLSRLRGEQFQVSFLKDKLSVYESLAFLSLERGTSPAQLSEAFQYVEEAKSRHLADTIAYPVHRDTAAQETGASAGRIQDLRRELEWHYRQMEMAALHTEPSSASRIEVLRHHARERETELVQRALHLRAADRTLAVLRGEGTLALEQIQAAVPADSSLVQYFPLRGTIYACVLDGGRLEIVPLAKAVTVQESVRLLRFQMSKFRLGEDYFETFGSTWKAATARHLRELYDAIVAPLRTRLGSSHLIVAPQGFLHYVPFHALYDGTAFLMDS